MRPAKTGTSMISLIECRKGRRGMDGLRSKGMWDRRLQDEAFNARSTHASSYDHSAAMAAPHSARIEAQEPSNGSGNANGR